MSHSHSTVRVAQTLDIRTHKRALFGHDELRATGTSLRRHNAVDGANADDGANAGDRSGEEACER